MKTQSTSHMTIIAEIGTSHQGERAKAQELIWAAKESGADCAKFQVVYADEIIHPLTGELDLPGGRVRLFDRFREVEQDSDFYFFCKEESERAGLSFLASPFGLKSARILHEIGVRWFKVASPELNHFPLLEYLKSIGKPVILSSGVSRLEDIERAVDVLGALPITLLHCITAYPAPPEEYNLGVLRPLATIFGCPIGVSDHSLDPTLIPLIGSFAGATLLEKHFCLSRTDAGLDDPIALDPVMFRSMSEAIREFEKTEHSDRRHLLDERFGTAVVQAVLGNGKKTLAPSEKANYERTNRSIHVMETLTAGHILRKEDLGILRTEKVLRPGLSPLFFDLVLGKTLHREVPAGEGLVWDDLLD